MTTAVKKQFGVLLLLAGCAAGQTNSSPATVQRLQVMRDGGNVRVEVILTGTVQARVVTAENPDRLVLELPDTVTNAKQRRINVGYNGVRGVRIGLNSAVPPETHVVVDLEGKALYELQPKGSTVWLVVISTTSAHRTRRVPPAAGASGSMVGIFSRKGKEESQQSLADIPLPPDSGHEALAVKSAGSSPQPSAQYPSRGSLQQGTVFPEMGVPATGNVPEAVAGTSDSSAVRTSTVQAQSNAIAVSAKSDVPTTKAQSASANAPISPLNRDVKVSRTTGSKSNTSAVPAFRLPLTTRRTQQSVQLPEPAVTVSITSTTEEPKVTSVAQAQDTAPVEFSTAAPVSATSASTGSGQTTITALASDPNLRTVFKVKYVAEGVAYLDGGRSAGLAIGMKLEIKDSGLPAKQGEVGDAADPHEIAELQVSGLADSSAVTDIQSPKRPVKPGDLAYLLDSDAEAVVQQRTLSDTRKYPAVVTFTEGDPLDEEARAEVPRPPMPSVNRARGRIGFDYMGTTTQGSPSLTSSELGLVLRADMTRIAGTYWNLSGYWRGRLTSSSSEVQPTLQDLINRTYHLSMTYDNPNSAWVAGFGRLYLPWAPSLDTIDGGYFGRRIGHVTTTGIFAGTTPDPTSWDYSPNRRIAGAFVNFEGGSYDHTHFTSTSGVGISTLQWQVDRPFIFFENSVSYKRLISIYDSLQADSPRGTPATPAPGPGLGMNFLTVRVQPLSRLELDFNYNYFRDVPTFDPTLIGTGLLDKYLFQGFSTGARVEVVKQVFVYTTIGKSNRSGDVSNSGNQMYGVTFSRLPWLKLRADAHYSRFSSSFGDGSYRAISLARDLNDGLHLEVLAGDQSFNSTLTTDNSSKFVTGNVESSLGTRFFMQGGFTANRGGTLNYNQWMFTWGYLFDSRARHK